MKYKAEIEELINRLGSIRCATDNGIDSAVAIEKATAYMNEQPVDFLKIAMTLCFTGQWNSDYDTMVATYKAKFSSYSRSECTSALIDRYDAADRIREGLFRYGLCREENLYLRDTDILFAKDYV